MSVSQKSRLARTLTLLPESGQLELSSIRFGVPRWLAPRSGATLELCKPSLRLGPRPLQGVFPDRRTRLDRLVSRFMAFMRSKASTEQHDKEWLSQLSELSEALRAMKADQLDDDRTALMLQMRHACVSSDAMDHALAHVIVAAQQTLKISPRLNQLLAVRAMLAGQFVELATGEGKTLCAAMTAAVAGLSGTPVHVLTANDYLADRDASSLRGFYTFLGLNVASVISTADVEQRRGAYRADVVYVTAKQVAFDWLNDSLKARSDQSAYTSVLGSIMKIPDDSAHRPILRGLCLAIVDEADSLLIDEARVPLILAASRSSDSNEQVEAAIALGLAEKLTEGVDYKVRSANRYVQITEAGQQALSRMSVNIAHSWRSSRFREERVSQALSALRAYQLDRDYIVSDGQLVLTDPHTGRPTPDRRLPHGVHLLLELKEKCRPSVEHETVARTSFQQFYRRYRELIGVSGTLYEVAGEIHDTYGCSVVRARAHCESQRKDKPSRVCFDRGTQLRTMMEAVSARKSLGQPVLVCTRSVEQSLGVSAFLTAHGLSHEVLNAYQDAAEAAIVACAGKAGSITVATNMAGRGTDISLDPDARDAGGLHVISLAFNDARRLDRQLAGRAARQGDPGSFEQLYCLDDSYLVDAMPAPVLRLARLCVGRGWNKCALVLIRAVQARKEYQHKSERTRLSQSSESLEKNLAFCGQTE